AAAEPRGHHGRERQGAPGRRHPLLPRHALGEDVLHRRQQVPLLARAQYPGQRARTMTDEADAPATDEQQPAADAADAVVVDRNAHTISRRRIPENVLKVLYRLHRSGYRAYLCGGSVRDLLTNRTPKDFDLATAAHPMEIRRLFRNSRIIGRRFRLAHIIFQDMIVEVSTFRREPERAPDDA